MHQHPYLTGMVGGSRGCGGGGSGEGAVGGGIMHSPCQFTSILITSNCFQCGAVNTQRLCNALLPPGSPHQVPFCLSCFFCFFGLFIPSLSECRMP